MCIFASNKIHAMDKKAIRAAVDEILDNQLRDNNPPETRQTLSRLQKEGRHWMMPEP